MGTIKVVTDEKLKEAVKNSDVICKVKEDLLDQMVEGVRKLTICSKIWIDECCVDEEGKFSYIIKFVNICGEEVSICVPRAEFTAGNIRKLVNEKGGYVYDDRLLYEFLKQYESYALGYDKPDKSGLSVKPMTLTQIFNKAGWCFLKNGTVGFVSSKGCFTEGNYQANTKYAGKILIAQKGNLTVYKNMIQEYIIDKKNTALQAILGMACASVLLWYFNNILHKQILNFIICLAGIKGTGKTTSLELCASFSGDPAAYSDGDSIAVYSTFNSTNNALTDLNFNNGYAVAIDDTQLCDNKLKDSTFYELASGKGKQRLKSNGRRANVNSDYKTGIFISAEKEIFQALTEGGLKPRILEFSDIMWTENSQISDIIKNIIYENYGLITPLIAEYIINHMSGDENKRLLDAFSLWEERFLKEAETNHFLIHDTPRFVKTLALFMVSLGILGLVMNQEYDIEAVYRFFYDNVIVKKAQEEQISQNVYEQLVDYVIENGDSFSAVVKSDADISNPMLIEEDESKGEIIRNTKKIAARVNGCEYSVFMPAGDALYILKNELGVKDFNQFLEDMLEANLLIWNETISKNGKKVPRLDSKYHEKRGYRFALPKDFLERYARDGKH